MFLEALADTRIDPLMVRTIHSLMIRLRAPEWLVAIVHPAPADGCLRLINSKRTWLTARAGDAVLLKQGDEWVRYFIESVSLYGVHPTSESAPDIRDRSDRRDRRAAGDDDSATQSTIADSTNR